MCVCARVFGGVRQYLPLCVGVTSLCVALVVWVVGGSLWHYSTAKYFTQIWPHLLIAEFYPPNKTSKACHLPFERFAAAVALLKLCIFNEKI